MIRTYLGGVFLIVLMGAIYLSVVNHGVTSRQQFAEDWCLNARHAKPSCASVAEISVHPQFVVVDHGLTLTVTAQGDGWDVHCEVVKPDCPDGSVDKAPTPP